MTLDTKDLHKIQRVPSIEDLYQCYRHRLTHFFVSKGLEREVAEDLGQEVFFRYLRCKKPMENEDHARNLLFRIAQNLLIDHFRKHNGSVRVRALASDDLAEEEPPCLMAQESGPEEVFVSSETSHDVRAVVSRLPLRYAQAIVLKEYEGFSYREIAAHMGVSQKAVESLLHRARSQLREELAEAGKKRGGWWSGLLVSLKGMKDSALFEPMRHGLSLGIGCAGVGKCIANVLAAIILLGSVVGTGVAASASARRGAPAAVPVLEEAAEPLAEAADAGPCSDVTAVDGAVLRGLVAVLEDAQDDVAESEVTPCPDGVTAVSMPVVDLLTGTTDKVREVIVSAGSGLDFILASLGQVTGMLVMPVSEVLHQAGMPVLLLDYLIDIACMQAVRDVNAGLVDTAVNATYLVDRTVTAVSSLPLPEPAITAPASRTAGGAEGITETAPSGPDAEARPCTDDAAEPAPGVRETTGIKPAATQVVHLLEDTAGGVMELVVDVTRVLGRFIPL